MTTNTQTYQHDQEHDAHCAGRDPYRCLPCDCAIRSAQVEGAETSTQVIAWEIVREWITTITEGRLLPPGRLTDLQSRIAAALDAVRERGTCTWTLNDDGYWVAECRGRFYPNSGAPMDARFCWFCGKILREAKEGGNG